MTLRELLADQAIDAAELLETKIGERAGNGRPIIGYSLDVDAGGEITIRFPPAHFRAPVGPQEKG